MKLTRMMWIPLFMLALAGCQNAEAPAEEKPVQQETVETDNNNEEAVQADDYGGKVRQAFADAGYEPSDISVEQSDGICSEFTATVENATVTVAVTECADVQQAQKIFDDHVAADEAENMAVMAKATEGSRTVNVVRNNRANRNYVEAVDTADNVVIHIENTLPEQLDPVLELLETLGWPKPEE